MANIESKFTVSKWINIAWMILFANAVAADNANVVGMLAYENQPAQHDVGLARHIRSAQTEKYYIEIVLVFDNLFYINFGKDIKNVYIYAKDVAKRTNMLFAPLNISIVLVDLLIWSEYDEFSMSNDGYEVLSQLMEYKDYQVRIKDLTVDYIHMFSGAKFEESYDYIGNDICVNGQSVGLTGRPGDEIAAASCLARAIGRQLGMHQDRYSCKCPDKVCLMSVVKGWVRGSKWSDCNMNFWRDNRDKDHLSCLKNKPKTPTVNTIPRQTPILVTTPEPVSYQYFIISYTIVSLVIGILVLAVYLLRTGIIFHIVKSVRDNMVDYPRFASNPKKAAPYREKTRLI